MATIVSFGHYLPGRILGNAELAQLLQCDAGWIMHSSGIEERRIAGADETVADLAIAAARNVQSNPGLVIVSSGSAERRFPGPAAQVANALGLSGIPAIDLPLASAGSLFAMALASQLAPVYGEVLVVAAEKMSGPALAAPLDKKVGILFGDGAGACVISNAAAGLQIVDSVLHSDGSYADDLRLEFNGPVQMNGRSVIMQATRKIPSAIEEILQRNKVEAESIRVFLLHQANQTLMDRVAKTVAVPAARLYSNIRRFGNTSSASMLIAASEWTAANPLNEGDTLCFAAFGAGYHWGALLARQSRHS